MRYARMLFDDPGKLPKRQLNSLMRQALVLSHEPGRANHVGVEYYCQFSRELILFHLLSFGSLTGAS